MKCQSLFSLTSYLPICFLGHQVPSKVGYTKRKEFAPLTHFQNRSKNRGSKFIPLSEGKICFLLKALYSSKKILFYPKKVIYIDI